MPKIKLTSPAYDGKTFYPIGSEVDDWPKDKPIPKSALVEEDEKWVKQDGTLVKVSVNKTQPKEPETLSEMNKKKVSV